MIYPQHWSLDRTLMSYFLAVIPEHPVYAVGQDDCDDESDGDNVHVILCMGVYVEQTFLMSTCGQGSKAASQIVIFSDHLTYCEGWPYHEDISLHSCTIFS